MSNRRLGRLLVILCLSLCFHSSFAENPPRRIDRERARAVIGDSEERWGGLVTRIEEGLDAGDEKWAEVARRLAPSSDAGSAEDLRFIVSRALPKSPRLVLGLVSKELPLVLGDICGNPFEIEEEDSVVHQHLLASERALMRLDLPDSPTLQEKQRRCLQQLRLAKCRAFGCGKENGRQTERQN